MRKNIKEMCFGISDYGEKRYTIEYVVDGFIISYTDSNNGVGLFGNTKNKISLKLGKMPTDQSAIMLHSILSRTSGEEGILQEKEIEKYSYINYEGLQSFINSAKLAGKSEFVNLGGFVNALRNKISDLVVAQDSSIT